MEALLYEKQDEARVRCHLCHQYCLIPDGRRGLCNVRVNRGGTLTTKVYDRVIALNVDPIEKKPLFHYYPGTLSYSFGTVGCNFRCRFCQNADIAQMATDHDGRVEGRTIPPEDIVAGAVKNRCKTIAYTYTEPTVFFELALDCAKLARERGIENVFVTNGYMSDDALDMISPWLGAANVDLKAFSDEFYKKTCGARLKPVLENLKRMKQLGIFVEVTTLLVPGLNDDPGELAELSAFIADDLGDETPWHISRFHPTYKLVDRPPTPLNAMLKAREIGMQAGLKYVYTGNVPGEDSENTFCWRCGEKVIARRGFFVSQNLIQDHKCPKCGAVIHGVGMSS